MNGGDLVIDTNIALYLLGGDKSLAELLFQKKIYLSVISEIELFGFSNLSTSEEKKLQAFLDDCIIIGLTDEIKHASISLRKRYRLKTPDAIIAATANYLNIPLISADHSMKKVNEVAFIHYQI